MLGTISFLILGLAALTLGAEALVRGSASLAVRLGLTPIVIGLTVVAFGTSTPELVVSLAASLTDRAGIAVGNVVGSNIFNLGVILGLTALLRPVKVSLQVIRYDGPIMTAASLLALFLLTRGVLSRPAGVLLLTALVAYTALVIWLARKEASPEIDQEFREGVPARPGSLGRDLWFIAGGLALLVAGSRLLVVSATGLARLAGISEAAIGLTVVAAGTSLPEMATSLVAARRDQPDIAVGNLVGSNIFNLLGILGAAALARPIPPAGVTALDLWVMVGFAVVLLPLLYTGFRLQRWEGALLLLGYGAYLWVLWPQG